MYVMKYIVLFSIVTVLLSGCATNTFTVQSTPEKADVFLVNPETGERQNIGKTPLVKKGPEIVEVLGEGTQPGRFLSIEIEKEGFQTKKLFVPSTASGNLGTEIKVTLKSDEKKKIELKSAQEILTQLYLAQRFARKKEFERALIAVDKLLDKYPEFDRGLSMKATIYYAKGEFKESLKWYEKAIEINPEIDTAVQMAAKVRKRLRLPAKAVVRKPSGG